MMKQHPHGRKVGSSGSLKAEVVNVNTLGTFSGSDLVFVPNLVLVGPAVFAEREREIKRKRERKKERE